MQITLEDDSPVYLAISDGLPRNFFNHCEPFLSDLC